MKKTWKMILKSTFVFAVVLLASISVAAQEQPEPKNEQDTVCKDLGITLHISRGKDNTINSVKVNGKPQKGTVSSDGMVFEINAGDTSLTFIIESYIENGSPNKHNKMTFRVTHAAKGQLEVRFSQANNDVFTAKRVPSDKSITVELEGKQSNNINFIRFYECFSTPQPELIDVTANKVWVNGPEVKPTIELQLFKNGVAFGGPVELVHGELAHTWRNLDKTDSKGVDHFYTVDEVEVPDNYEKSVGGLTVTNTYKSPEIDITGTKKWVGGSDDRPTIELQLYRDGVALGDSIKLLSGDTTHTWTGLDETDSDGKDYIYTVDEVNVPENYEKSVDGFVITNRYVSPLINIIMTKEWVGEIEEFPTIQIQLFRNDEAFGAPIELVDGATSATWADLDKTDENGVDYVYTVDEVAVPEGYAKTVDGFTITNTFIDPVDPIDPIDPVDPTDPEDPTDPVDPVDPIDPVDPVEPVDPIDPVDPINPIDPVDPVDPINPIDPVDPSPEPSLPVTGGASLAALYIAGFAAIFTGTLLIKKRNKK